MGARNVKITLERLREIITEEVIKESVSPEDAQRTIVALLQDTPPNVTGDIMGAVYDEMYDADVSEPSAEPEEEEEEQFWPKEYQAGAAYGDRPNDGRPTREYERDHPRRILYLSNRARIKKGYAHRSKKEFVSTSK